MQITKEEQTIAECYTNGMDVKDLAREFGRSSADLVKLLARLGVFSSRPITVALKSTRTTKSQLVDRLASATSIPREKIATIEKANHEAIELLLDKILNPS
jgi:hypothetical protein